MTRESLASAHSPSLPPHKATRPGPVTSGLLWRTDCVMLRRGSWALCAGSDLWTATLWACQHPSRVRDSSDRVSVWSYTDYHCPSIPELFCLRVCDMCVSKSSYLKPKRFPFVPVCKFMCSINFSTIHTCARHLERIWVGAIVSISANTVNSAFAGGAAVDGTLHAGLISLSWLEKARQAGWKTQEKKKFKSQLIFKKQTKCELISQWSF